MDLKMARKTWEMSNNVEGVSTVDEIYRYDERQQRDILAAKPWEKEYEFRSRSYKNNWLCLGVRKSDSQYEEN